MADVLRPQKPYPWPWGQPSILITAAEEERRRANHWLDADLGEDNDDSDSDYVQSDSSDASTSDSDERMNNSTLDSDISESELPYIRADAQTGWPSSPTPSLKALEEQADWDRKIVDLIKAEQDVAAAYEPDEVVSLITQLYKLLVTMGHWPEGSLRYPPHTDPPVNEELAVQLGYTPAAVSIMRQLPYVSSNINGWYDDKYEIVARTRIADYTNDHHLKEGRRPYPYEYLDGCPDLDPWLLPLMLPKRYGWHVMLDTNLGAIRAYDSEGPPCETVEWRRHGEVPQDGWVKARWTEYRRAALVPAARYFEEVIYAYRSLSRLPVIKADYNDPNDNNFLSTDEEREEQQTLLTLYHECGWPDEWRREEFVAKWDAKKEEIVEKWRRLRAEHSK
ncbi:SWIM-type domain-containing protein [Mycena venus]|uniref:SWIM-type domain-containing protein n=1 Tax=Mycena venus TaxID=2733690 RepID=A0A8H7CPF9_9AGAR|nr:SWIM-type domain-containing protein [Mycena venus]